MKKLFLVIAAALLGAATVVLWNTYHTEPNHGRMSEADQRFLSGGQDPATLRTPTPFQQKMFARGYDFDTRTRRWYPIYEAWEKYRCYATGEPGNSVFHCPGAMPPGIPDEEK
jgi:hypothetical protein